MIRPVLKAHTTNKSDPICPVGISVYHHDKNRYSVEVDGVGVYREERQFGEACSRMYHLERLGKEDLNHAIAKIQQANDARSKAKDEAITAYYNDRATGVHPALAGMVKTK